MWALSYPATVALLAEVGPSDLTAIRFALAAIVMLLLRPRTVISINQSDWWRGSVLGILLALGTWMQTRGLQTLSQTSSGFTISLFVVLTPLLGWLFFRHHISRPVWSGVFLATLGLVAVSVQGIAIKPGMLITLGSALFYSLYFIAASALSRPERAYRLSAIQMMVGAVFATVIAAPDGLDLPQSSSTWGWLIYLVIGATVVTYTLQTWAQSHLTATHAAILLTSEPAFVALFAWIGGHTPNAREIFGGSLILAASIVIQRKPRSQAMPAPVPTTPPDGRRFRPRPARNRVR